MLIRHGESASNVVLEKIKAEFKGQENTPAHIEALLAGQKLNEGQVDALMTDGGYAQVRAQQESLNKVNVHSIIYCSPMRRAIATAQALLESHPNKANMRIQLVPIMKEGLVDSNCCHGDYRQLKDFCEDSVIPIDFSLFELEAPLEGHPNCNKFEEPQNCWGFEILTNPDQRKRLVDACKENDNSTWKAFSTCFDGNPDARCEPDFDLFDRSRQVKEFIYARGKAIEGTGEKLLFIGHNRSLRALMAKEVQPGKADGRAFNPLYMF